MTALCLTRNGILRLDIARTNCPNTLTCLTEYIKFFFFFFFFQAEDGIRDHCVTGVQTCALPISTELTSILTGLLLLIAIGMDFKGGARNPAISSRINEEWSMKNSHVAVLCAVKIGRASCRERV